MKHRKCKIQNGKWKMGFAFLEDYFQIKRRDFLLIIEWFELPKKSQREPASISSLRQSCQSLSFLPRDVSFRVTYACCAQGGGKAPRSAAFPPPIFLSQAVILRARSRRAAQDLFGEQS
jgi:hypothetical protein